MLEQEEIAEIIFAKTLEVTESLGEEAGLVFLQGVNFGVEIALKSLKFLRGIDTQDTNLEEINDFYLNVTKGEIN